MARSVWFVERSFVVVWGEWILGSGGWGVVGGRSCSFFKIGRGVVVSESYEVSVRIGWFC